MEVSAKGSSLDALSKGQGCAEEENEVALSAKKKALMREERQR